MPSAHNANTDLVRVGANAFWREVFFYSGWGGGAVNALSAYHPCDVFGVTNFVELPHVDHLYCAGPT